jgi:hypothetical protein
MSKNKSYYYHNFKTQFGVRVGSWVGKDNSG